MVICTSKYPIITTLYDDDEVNIMARSEVNFKRGNKGLGFYRILKVVSPDEIYLIEDDQRKIEYDWIEDMQKFYREDHQKDQLSAQLRQLFNITTPQVKKGRCYVYFGRDSNCWHRVRVFDPDIGHDMAKVMLEDFNVKRHVLISEMMEIYPKIAQQPTLNGLVGHLAHIRPPRGGTEWSEEIIKTLKEMCSFNKTFNGVILSSDLTKSQFGLILTENKKGSRHTLQWELIDKGLADGCGLSAGRHDLLPFVPKIYATPGQIKIIETVPVFNSKEFKASLANRQLSSFNSTIKEPRNSFYFSDLSRGPMPDPISKVKNGVKKERTIPLKMQKSLARIVITAIHSPSVFYIQMRNQCQNLRVMMMDMGTVVQNEGKLSIEEIREGEIVAAEVMDNNNISHWARAVINEVNQFNVEVILIDFGIEMTVTKSRLRQLPDYFLTISPFCQRAHLDVKVKNQSSWSHDMIDVFRSYVHDVISEDVIYYCWQLNERYGERNVELNEFNQELFFQGEEGEIVYNKWFPQMPSMNSPYIFVNRLKNHSLLKQFFVSIGIDIVYEIETTDTTPQYDLHPIWDILVNNFKCEITHPLF